MWPFRRRSKLQQLQCSYDALMLKYANCFSECVRLYGALHLKEDRIQELETQLWGLTNRGQVSYDN
jgi:hypothetical protein